VRVWVHEASQALKVAHAHAPATVWLLRIGFAHGVEGSSLQAAGARRSGLRARCVLSRASPIATLRGCFRERDADEQTAGIAVQQIDASTVSEDY